MAKVKISGSATGTATYTIQSPSGNTDRVLTLPDEAGTVLTSASDLPAANLTGSLPAGMGGKVLQVVQGSTSTYLSTSADTYIDTGLSASITPSSASSKVLVFVNHSGSEKDAGNVNTNQKVQLLRSSTVIWTSGDHLTTGVSAATYMDGPNAVYLDSPSTTSATTYKTQFKATSGYGITYVNLGGTSTIVLMEIAG